VIEYIDVVIIGAGQAGLAISYHLTQQARQHVILEQAAAIVPAWRGRWESFTLVLPNWTVKMPGFDYHGDDPDGFMGRDELVSYMEDYVATFEPEIRFGWQVTSVEGDADGKGYLVRSPQGDIRAGNVVVAAGTFQKGRIPAFSERLTAGVSQIHSGDYVNPGSLTDGAVLVVGTGQSGCQIAEELYQSGRKVYLCVGGAGRVPRRGDFAGTHEGCAGQPGDVYA
jgi:putative flavoprotein involved in K+ transport